MGTTAGWDGESRRCSIISPGKAALDSGALGPAQGGCNPGWPKEPPRLAER